MSKQGITTSIERKTRRYVAIKIPNNTGKSMTAAIKHLVGMYSRVVK